MWVMIVLQTLGAVDMPGKGVRKLPSPRVYVPVIVSFAVLELIADMGMSRAAKYLGWLAVLATLVLGPFGTKLATMFESVASNAVNPPTPNVPIPGGSGTTITPTPVGSPHSRTVSGP